MGKAGGRFTETAGIVDGTDGETISSFSQDTSKRKTLAFICRIKEDEKDSSFP